MTRRATLHGRPVPALAGTLGEGAQDVPGVDARHGTLPAPMALAEATGGGHWRRPLAEALTRASELLTDPTERALRMALLGARPPIHLAVPGTGRP